MHPEDLCAALKPVHGEQVDRLRYAWLAGSPEDKRLIEVRLNRLYDALSQGKEMILLDPPSMQDAFGKYVLGEVLYGETGKHHFGLREDEWIQHMAIFGRSGSGKTNLVMGILWNFVRHGKPFLIFDWKRNYRDFLSVHGTESVQLRTVGRDVKPLHFNLWLPPPGIERNVWIKKIVEVLNHAYFAGEGVMDILMRALSSAYEQTETPLTADVLREVEAVPETSRAAQWKQSALRILRALDFGPMGEVTRTEDNSHVPTLLNEQVILELDALADSDKTALIEALLLWIHGYRLNAPVREKFRHAIIIEEAHHILLKKKQETKGEAITDVILREIRELGESIIIVDQHPSLISLPAIGNSYTQICFNLKDQYDTQRAAQSMLLDRSQQDYLGLLPVGEAIVKLQGRHLRPFHIRVPKVALEKGTVDDQQLHDGVQRTIKLQLEGLDFTWCKVPDSKHWIKVPSLITGSSGSGTRMKGEPPAAAPVLAVRVSDKLAGLSDRERRLLDSIIANPLLPTLEQYKKLSLSRWLGHQAKEELLRQELVQPVLLQTRRGRITLFEPTEPVKKELKLAKLVQPSLEHRFWVKRIAEHLDAAGFSVAQERINDGHAPDIIATRDGQKILVEVETGKSDFLSNFEKAAGTADKIYMLATNETALRRLEAKLPQASNLVIMLARDFQPP